MHRLDDAASPDRLDSTDVTVAIVDWPDERERAAALTHAGTPKLLLVAEGVSPPDDWDGLTDWIRLPADPQDIWARVAALQRRARRRPPPRLDEFGVVWRGRHWVALAPVEARVVAPLLERPGEVFSRRQLARLVWPEGVSNDRVVDSYVKRLRRRISPVGLSIHTVRQRGYFLAIDADLVVSVTDDAERIRS